MANPMDSYPARTVLLIALIPVVIIATLSLEGAWRLVAIAALLGVVALLSATVGAQVTKMRDARKLT